MVISGKQNGTGSNLVKDVIATIKAINLKLKEK